MRRQGDPGLPPHRGGAQAPARGGRSAGPAPPHGDLRGSRVHRLRAGGGLQAPADRGLRRELPVGLGRRGRRHRVPTPTRAAASGGWPTASATTSSSPTPTASATSTSPGSSPSTGATRAPPRSPPSRCRRSTAPCDLDGDGRVHGFREKPRLPDHLINAGFFVFDQRAFDLWPDPGEDLERDVLPALGALDELFAFRHLGFWKSMDTYKDAVDLEHAVRRRSRALAGPRQATASSRRGQPVALGRAAAARRRARRARLP